MGKILKTDYYNLLDVVKEVNNPFSRENRIAKLKSNFGEGTFVWYDSGSGIGTATNNYKLHQDTLVTLKSNVSGAILIFNLANDFTYHYKDGKNYTIKKNSYFLGFSSDKFSVDIELKKNTHYNTLTVGIKEELFLKLAYDLENLNEKMNEAIKNTYAILEGGKIDPEQMETLHYFKDKNLDEYLLTDLYLESKTTNLIQYTIKKTINNINSNLNLDKNIITSLQKAKELISNEYASSLSIKQIAYKSAINECYLKKDFKAYYGMTVYEMIQKQRLDVAKNLLQENFSVKEVALQVGYKHSGHFSKLFSEYFGVTPSVYRKQFN